MGERLQPNPEEVARFETESRSSKTLDLLRAKGGLEEVNGKQMFDPEMIQALLRRDPEKQWQKPPVKVEDLIEDLRGLKGYQKSDLYQQEFTNGEMPMRTVLPLPRDIQSLGQDYSKEADGAVINVWDLEPKATRWNRKIQLDSGEEASTAELYVAAQLQGPLKSRRDQDGTLEIFDAGQNKYVKFSFNGFERLTGKRVQVTSPKGTRVSFKQGAMFVGSYLPNLVKLGLLRQEDFRTRTGSKSAEIYRVHERRINPKAPTVNFGNEVGMVKYYIGRDKLVGTDIPTRSITVIQLDPERAGIIEDQHGRHQLVYTFDLLSDEETQKKREAILEKSPQLSPSGISARTVVGASEMRSRMKQYDVTNVIPKREDESAEEYGKRISDLSDFEYVARKFQGFFAEAEIGVHKLPWSEQLILANAISEERDRDRLLGFAKKYGVEGLRTFLAMDYDPELGQDILTMSEEFEQDVNRDIFGAYNRLVDQANELSRVVRKSDLFAEVELDEQVLEDFIPQFTESILRRAKDMLITGTTIAKKGQAETLDYAQQRITASDPREVAESLEIYAEASEKVNCLLGTDGQATRFRFEMIGSESESIPVSYSFQVLEDSGALSYMTIQLRKTGTKEPNLDREFDGEARINFLFSERPISLSVGDESRSNALSLRVDREGKVRESGQIRVNDPTMQQGEVSVEIGSLNYDDPKLPGALVGRIVSVGNGIANSSHGKEVQYYHNRESFSQALGRAETFAQIVRFIENQLERNFGQRLKQTA